MKIFLSYSHRDAALAENIYEALQSWGHDVWIDHNNIRLGDMWSNEIDKALQWADVTLGIMTNNAINSDNVLNEWHWTIVYEEKFHNRLILLKVDDCLVPHYFIRINWIPMLDIGQQAAYTLLQKRLEQPIENIARTSAPAADDPYSTYLQQLYSELEEELHFLVLSVERLIDIPIHETPEFVQTPQKRQEKRRMMPVFSRRSHLDDESVTIETFKDGFEAFDKRVLLLGDPGSGKTITVLTHARNAVLARLQDATQPLPILGRIATWNARERTPLHDWLAQFTPLTPAIIKKEIDAGNCLLILDGLDELGAVDEDAKFDISNFDTGKLNQMALNTIDDLPQLELSPFDPRKRFIEHIPSNNQVIVSCRIKDYEHIGQKVLLNGAVTLHTLDDDHIKMYLSGNESTENLWMALRKQPQLMDIARVPLLLSLFAFAYQDLPEKTQQLQDLSEEELRDTIFEQYLTKRYEHELYWQHQSRNESPPYSLDLMYRVLGEIAFEQYGRQIEIGQTALAYGLYKQNIVEDASTFSDYVNKLHILVKIGNGWFRFIHLLLRDYFAQTFCLQFDVKHTNRLILMRAIKIVRDVGGPKAFRFIQDILQESDDRQIIFYCIQALRVLGNTKAVPLLVDKTLHDNNLAIRKFAAIAAADINADRAAAIIHHDLDNQDLSTHFANNALAALNIFRSADSIPLLSHWYLTQQLGLMTLNQLRRVLLTCLEQHETATSHLISDYLAKLTAPDQDNDPILILNVLEHIATSDDLTQIISLITTAPTVQIQERMVNITNKRGLVAAAPYLVDIISILSPNSLLMSALQAFLSLDVAVDDQAFIRRLAEIVRIPPTKNIGLLAEDVLITVYKMKKEDIPQYMT